MCVTALRQTTTHPHTQEHRRGPVGGEEAARGKREKKTVPGGHSLITIGFDKSSGPLTSERW